MKGLRNRLATLEARSGGPLDDAALDAQVLAFLEQVEPAGVVLPAGWRDGMPDDGLALLQVAEQQFRALCEA